MNTAVSRTQARGGRPSGALGILDPVQSGTGVNKAFKGGTSAQGIDSMTASETGMMKPLAMPTIRPDHTCLLDLTGS